MNDNCCEKTKGQVSCSHGGSGLVIVVVLYILLVVILSSFGAC